MKPNTYNVTLRECRQLAHEINQRLCHALPNAYDGRKLRVYAVPRGGVYAALLCADWELVNSPLEADIILDDILDSGATRNKMRSYGIPFVALVSKQLMEDTPWRAALHVAQDCWVTFPWELVQDEEQGAEDNVRRMLQAIGEDPQRDGLLDTPKRFIKALKEMTQGYHSDPKAHLGKDFDITDAGGRAYDQIIISKDLPFVSLCEHHLLAFEGRAHIAYLPSPESKRVVGLSKLARVLDGYAKRLQVQERLTMQIADAIEEVLQPAGVAVILKAKHSCQCHRGVGKAGEMVTSALHGVFRDNGASRMELFHLLKL
jgi:GTP cyclohydrolase I